MKNKKLIGIFVLLFIGLIFINGCGDKEVEEDMTKPYFNYDVGNKLKERDWIYLDYKNVVFHFSNSDDHKSIAIRDFNNLNISVEARFDEIRGIVEIEIGDMNCIGEMFDDYGDIIRDLDCHTTYTAIIQNKTRW